MHIETDYGTILFNNIDSHTSFQTVCGRYEKQ